MIRKNKVFFLLIGVLFILSAPSFLHAEKQSQSRWIDLFKSYSASFISKGPMTNIAGLATTFTSGALAGSMIGGVSFLACKNIMEGLNKIRVSQDATGTTMIMAAIIGTTELYILDHLAQQLHDNLMSADTIKDAKYIEIYFHLFATMALLFSGTTFGALSWVTASSI